MARLIYWLAAQIDGRLSGAGAIYALIMTATAIGGLVALTADKPLIATAVLGIAAFQLLLLVFVALRTDPCRKLTDGERAAAWAKAPRFLKVSLYLLAGGQVADFLLQTVGGFPHASIFGLSCTAASSFVFGRGMVLHRPPIPRVGAEPLTFEASPAEYQRQAAQVRYASFLVAALLSALVAWRLFR